jgi:hypothetical protein
VDEASVTATEVVELEELEDLGPIWAEGEAVDVAWALRGARLRPARTITVEAQRTLRRPEDLELLAGRLDELERLLEGSTQP